MKKIKILCFNAFIAIESSVKQSDPGNFARLVIFSCQKYVKKGYIEITKKIYLEPLKSVLGCSLSHYFAI